MTAIGKLITLSAALFLCYIGQSFGDTSLLETTVVFGKRQAQPVFDSTASLSKVGEEQLQRLDAVHFNGIGASAPATWVSRGSGQESLTAIRSPVLTGSGACGAFMMTEDTVPLRASGFCNVNQLFDSHYEQAESVEVLRGPNAAEYGSNALFGGINVQLPSPSESRPARLSMSLADFGYARLGGQAQFEGGGQWWLGATLVEDDGYRADSGVSQQKISVKQANYGAHWRSVQGVTFNHLDQETAGYLQGDNAYKDKDLIRTNASPEAWRKAKSVRAYSQWTRETAEGRWTVMPYARYHDMAFLMHFVPWRPEEQNDHASVGLYTRWQGHDRGNFLPSIGLEVEATEGHLQEWQANPAPFNQAAFPEGMHYDYSVQARNAAVFLGAQWLAGDDWVVSWQGRLDGIDYRYNNQLAPGSACAASVTDCRFYRPADQDNHYSFFSQTLTVLWSYHADHRMFAKLANGFRAPQTAELYRLQQGQRSAELNEVQLNGFEWGLRGQWPAVSYALTGYWMALQDDIFQDSERQYVSGAETAHNGIEVKLDWVISPSIRASVIGAYAEHEYANSPNVLGSSVALEGLQMDTAPRTLGAMSLQWRPHAHWQFESRINHLGHYFTNPENTHDYPGHTLLDLTLHHQVSAQWRWQVNLDNALNTRFADRADIAFGTPRYFPGQERTIRLGVTWVGR